MTAELNFVRHSFMLGIGIALWSGLRGLAWSLEAVLLAAPLCAGRRALPIARSRGHRRSV